MLLLCLWTWACIKVVLINIETAATWDRLSFSGYVSVYTCTKVFEWKYIVSSPSFIRDFSINIYKCTNTMYFSRKFSTVYYGISIYETPRYIHKYKLAYTRTLLHETVIFWLSSKLVFIQRILFSKNIFIWNICVRIIEQCLRIIHRIIAHVYWINKIRGILIRQKQSFPVCVRIIKTKFITFYEIYIEKRYKKKKLLSFL